MKHKKRNTRQRPKQADLAAPRTLEDFYAMSEESQDEWNRIVHAISKKRTTKVSLQGAAREFGVSPKVLLQLAGSALRLGRNGRYVAKPTDNLLRVLVTTTPDGLKEIAVRDSRVASTIGSHSDAVQKYVRTGDSSSLKEFRHLKITDASGKPIELLTDTDELDRLASAGQLSFESLYTTVG
jgi:hypothetical protein